MMQSSVRDTTSTGGKFQPTKDPFWSALTDDTNLPVLIVDANGVIEFANGVASKIMGTDPTNASGKNLREFFSEELVTERLGLIREAVNTGRPITIEGMVKGRLMRAVFRPMMSPGQPPRVLVTSRLAIGDQTGEGVVHARVNDSGALASLTARELEILKLIGVGLSTADIAKKLGRSVKTVEWHRVSLGDKLGVTNRVELARIAIAAGLVGLDEPVSKHGEN
ncbi:MAG TPA: LuxR C-terminal-related transcriptional regulator [Phycisphaerales bacterium]|nr:LuxR C-terminal-related transcriptional regulator [Phycisphaerales bacterium]